MYVYDEVSYSSGDTFTTYGETINVTQSSTFLDAHPNTVRAIFDESFAAYLPTSTKEWFYFCSKLTSVEHLENLNTSQVTDMSKMFGYCQELSSIVLTVDKVIKVYFFALGWHKISIVLAAPRQIKCTFLPSVGTKFANVSFA